MLALETQNSTEIAHMGLGYNDTRYCYQQIYGFTHVGSGRG